LDNMADRRTQDMQEINAVFDSFGVKLILVYGALLGHHRDKNFLPGDDDVDFCVIDKIDYKTRKEIGWVLLNLGYEPQPVAFNVFGKLETQEPGYNGDEHSGIIVCQKNFKFTIFFFGLEECSQHGWEYVCVPKYKAMKLISTPAKFFTNLGEIKIGKKKYLTPSPVEDYLNWAYFNDYKNKDDRRHSPLYDKQHEEIL
jgi:hypothetical protein